MGGEEPRRGGQGHRAAGLCAQLSSITEIMPYYAVNVLVRMKSGFYHACQFELRPRRGGLKLTTARPIAKSLGVATLPELRVTVGVPNSKTCNCAKRIVPLQTSQGVCTVSMEYYA